VDPGIVESLRHSRRDTKPRFSWSAPDCARSWSALTAAAVQGAWMQRFGLPIRSWSNPQMRA